MNQESKKKKILIADDDADVVQSLRDRLEYEGYEIVAAFEGMRAIESAHKDRPDLILLDIRMPAGSGQTVLMALRNRPDTVKIPVIVLTALQEPGLEYEVKRLGAQDFQHKPCDLEKLLSSVRGVLG